MSSLNKSKKSENKIEMNGFTHQLYNSKKLGEISEFYEEENF